MAVTIRHINELDVCFIFVFTDIYVIITKAFGLPKPSLFCNVQRDVSSLPSYSKLNSKCNHWNSHVLPHFLLVVASHVHMNCLLDINVIYTLRKNA